MRRNIFFVKKKMLDTSPFIYEIYPLESGALFHFAFTDKQIKIKGFGCLLQKGIDTVFKINKVNEVLK